MPKRSKKSVGFNAEASVGDAIGSAKKIAGELRNIYVERHDYRDARESDFKAAGRNWYDASTRELTALGYRLLGDIVDDTIAKAAERKDTDDDDDEHEEPNKTVGWLQGSMDEYFGTPGEIADDFFQDGGDWINLLALHSRGSMLWSDSGDLYFLIRRSALKARNFSNVLAIACSS